MSASHFMVSNPIIRKVAVCEEMDMSNAVTYAGISKKVLFFLSTVIVGIALFFLLNGLGDPLGLGVIETKNFTIELNSLTVVSMIGLIAATLIFIISPIVTAIYKVAIPVNGALYCLSTGYIITFLGFAVPRYRTPIFLALFLTVALFAGLALLYSTGKIKVTEKFKAVFMGIVLASLIFSLAMLILAFIPALRFIPEFFAGNSLVAILFSILGLIIAAIFVVVDFSVIQEAVDRQLPKNYEWFCAYGLVFSLIYLYFKVLEIVLKATSKSSSSSKK